MPSCFAMGVAIARIGQPLPDGRTRIGGQRAIAGPARRYLLVNVRIPVPLVTHAQVSRPRPGVWRESR